jgi:hypothetical protein
MDSSIRSACVSGPRRPRLALDGGRDRPQRCSVGHTRDARDRGGRDTAGDRSAQHRLQHADAPSPWAGFSFSGLEQQPAAWNRRLTDYEGIHHLAAGVCGTLIMGVPTRRRSWPPEERLAHRFSTRGEQRRGTAVRGDNGKEQAGLAARPTRGRW